MTRTTNYTASKFKLMSLMDYALLLPLIPIAYSMTFAAFHFIGVLALLLGVVIMLVGGTYWLHPGGHAWGQWQMMSRDSIGNERGVSIGEVMVKEASVIERGLREEPDKEERNSKGVHWVGSGDGRSAKGDIVIRSRSRSSPKNVECKEDGENYYGEGNGEGKVIPRGRTSPRNVRGTEDGQSGEDKEVVSSGTSLRNEGGSGDGHSGQDKEISRSRASLRNVRGSGDGNVDWRNNKKNDVAIPGPRGLPFLGSLLAFSYSTTPHRILAAIAASCKRRRRLMALSLASTRIVVSSHPSTARSILCSAAFSDRPLTQSARHLLFNRAIGFSPAGDRWRRLRRLSATHLFSPRRLSAHLPLRHLDADAMLAHISHRVRISGTVQQLRPFLQQAALNSIMNTVFGKRYTYGFGDGEAAAVQKMVREGFELLGAFNMADHLPATFEIFDPLRIRQRCNDLVPQVYAFVHKIIEDHRRAPPPSAAAAAAEYSSSDFVSVLLRLQEEEKLTDAEIVSVLWEMIFRGTDTMAILTEWILAELTLHPDVQERLRAEVSTEMAPAGGGVSDSEVARMAYLQAVVKEGLRMHPPGPLLSWARLAVHDTEVDGYVVPAGTTAMVNMWAITHDPEIWENPEVFDPARFLPGGTAAGVEVGGTDMRLAPFGGGVRSCPGKAMAMATVQLWVARIVQKFHLSPDGAHPVDLSEILKLSCQMVNPLTVKLVQVNQDPSSCPGYMTCSV